MRKFLLLFMLLAYFVSCSQEEIYFYKDKAVSVNDSLRDISNRYILEARENGLEMEYFKPLSLIRLEDSILSKKYSGLLYGKTEFYSPQGNIIVILNRSLLENKKLLDLVFYHEMFHVYTRIINHCDDPGCPVVFQPVATEESLKRWDDSAKKHYFEMIKQFNEELK